MQGGSLNYHFSSLTPAIDINRHGHLTKKQHDCKDLFNLKGIDFDNYSQYLCANCYDKFY